MKKTMYDIFDEATASEIETLVNQNAAPDVSADTLSAVKSKVYAKTGIANSKKKKPFLFRWQSYAAAAACLCVIAGVMFGTGVFKFPGVQPNDIVEPDIVYYSLNDLLNREDFASIIWGSGASEDVPAIDPDYTLSDPDCNEPVQDEEIWVEWNGIKISVNLHELLQDLNGDDLIAVGIESWADPALLYDDYVALVDYVYNGKTYSDILTELEQAEELQDMLVRLKKFSSHFGELIDEEKEAYWEELYEAATDELIFKYFQGDKKSGTFDTTSISDDLAACDTEVQRLRNELAACRREYKAKFSAVPNLSKMMNKGYYVVGNGDAFAVILSVEQFQQFAVDVREVYGEEIMDTVMLRMATQSELGVEIIPEDEIPMGEAEDEQIPDDIIDEPAV